MGKFRAMMSSDQRLYLGIIFILVLLLGYYNWKMALLGIIVLGSLLYYSMETAHRRRTTLEEYLKSLAMQVETTAHDIIYNLPWGVAVLDEDGVVRWCNPRFIDLFPGAEIIDENLDELFPGVKLAGKEFSTRVRRGDRWFDLYFHRVYIRQGTANNFVLFVRETTREEELLACQEKDAPCIGFIQVDNYEEVLQSVEPDKKPLLVAAIDRVLTEWATAKRALLQKYADDRYLVMLRQGDLAVSQEEKFPLLDRSKEIKLGNKLPVTLSCGFGKGAASIQEVGTFARAALDLALGRGGDQVVVRDPERFHFFGGQTKAPEKRTKVKARVIAHALRELVDEAAQVMIMGHQVADMDSLGAAAGMAQAVRSLGKPVYVVLEEVNPAVEKLVSFLQDHKDFRGLFLNPQEALRTATPDTLLVVVDTHKPTLVAEPQLLERTKKVVIIDHHRRGEEFIPDPILVYLETYASSASELVTELLQYLLGDNMEVNPRAATALLAGIAVDTKNFSYQAGVRTFEAAAFLRRSGADQDVVQRVLQDDWETFVHRAEVIKGAEIFYGRVALAIVPNSGDKAQLLAAQAADELLTIEGIEASFVICSTDEGVSISARSTGDINVQVIMEQLDGGGHMTIAGAQLVGSTMVAAREMVVKLIHDYFSKEGEG